MHSISQSQVHNLQSQIQSLLQQQNVAVQAQAVHQNVPQNVHSQVSQAGGALNGELSDRFSLPDFQAMQNMAQSSVQNMSQSAAASVVAQTQVLDGVVVRGPLTHVLGVLGGAEHAANVGAADSHLRAQRAGVPASAHANDAAGAESELVLQFEKCPLQFAHSGAALLEKPAARSNGAAHSAPLAPAAAQQHAAGEPPAESPQQPHLLCGKSDS